VKFEQWKRNLQKRLLEYLTRECRVPAHSGPIHTLETWGELHEYVAGVAAAFSIFLGRGVTESEVEETLCYDGYVGGAWLPLNSLQDWGVVEYAPRDSDGEIEFPFKARVVISEKLRQAHNHSICCPGCDHCPNFFRKSSMTA
jgi:hypothetical protein